jgi:nucleotide-binding universal stress UspA family protein
MDVSSQDVRPVVVGVDSSDCAREAAGWAADLAVAWGAPLHLVHVVPARPAVTGTPPWLGELLDSARGAGVASPRADILGGVPADLLAARAVDARMLVLGSYGEGASSGMLAGSLALALLDGVTCPVAVVRGPTPQLPPPPAGPVVVGVDGSRTGRAALEFAAGIAGSLRAPLVAVHTWTDVVAGAHGATLRSEDPATLAAEGATLLEAELDTLAAAHPGLTVQRDLVDDTSVGTLLDRARGARLLVVGHRGHDTGSSMLHSSTARTLVAFAPCPVVVIRPAAVPTWQARTAHPAESKR